jgi:hypothetical protein
MVSSSHKIIFICGREGNFLRLLINIKGKRNSRKRFFLFLYFYFVEGLDEHGCFVHYQIVFLERFFQISYCTLQLL